MMNANVITDMLVTSAKAVSGFKTVAPMPLSKVLDFAKFFTKLPAMELPACLIVLADDEQRGARIERDINWLWIVIVKAVKGDAWRVATDLAENLRENHLNRNIQDRLYIGHESRMVVIDTPPDYCMLSVTFSSRNYGRAT